MADDVIRSTPPGGPLTVRLCNFVTGQSAVLPAHDTWAGTELAPLLTSSPGAFIDLHGFASKLGFRTGDSAEKNRKLSEARCNAVRTMILSKFPGAKFNR